eukprot:TRINITY_DN6859_c0_g1_i3.p2 TRINITY_DN6859_c0_g1~~TRINITY_DN6859_c0_g1_i3.p2  ORF type:complete len:115 (-),score=3.21 TRINITY_DN6859_c0_g1_i3:314-658(-)
MQGFYQYFLFVLEFWKISYAGDIYFQGKCSRENCPFLHIYLGSCVKPCKDFLAGYCAKGSECTQLHLTKKQLEKYQLLNASRDKTIDKINNRIINKHSVPTQIDEISFLPSFLK